MENVFDLFERRLRDVVRQRFKQPTHIQNQAIPLVLQGKNLLLISETGSGKTESVFLPVINQFLKEDHAPISILYITPMKSLNRDLLKRILWWGGQLDFEVAVRHGDTTTYERGMQAANPSDMVISTPETLQAILVGKVMRSHLKNVRWVIIDEIHELVDNKRGAQLAIGLERLRRLVNGNLQVIGLSATIGSPKNVASFLGENFTIIDAAREKRVKICVDSPKIKKEDHLLGEKMMLSPQASARVRMIRDIINQRTAVLVFTNTRETAEVLSSRLKVLDSSLSLETHHSSLSKEVRIQAEMDFRDQKLRALLCTSSLELGIDIGAIDYVLQFLSPRQVMKFLQRIGRAGHSIEKFSEGMIMSGDVDDCFESAVIAQRALEKQIEETHIYEKALDVLGHQVVGLTLEDYSLPMEKAYEIIKKAYPFRNLKPEEFLEVCKLMEKLRTLWINDKDGSFARKYNAGEIEKEDRFKGKRLEDLVLRRRKDAWLYYYQNLSTIPDVRTYKVHDVYTDRPVGSLDAQFIALHGGQGQSVIVKGQAWRILDVGQTNIMVEPIAGIQAAIPAWEGELIPVPYEIAQGVARMRQEVAQEKDPKKYLTDHYPVSSAVAGKMVKAVNEQKNWGFVPAEKDLLIEYDRENVIFHTCWGSLVNDTIGRALCMLLTGHLGSVGLQTDPYRIVLKTAGWGWKEATEVFLSLTPEKMLFTLKQSLPLTELFQWRFLHIAKRLGIISRTAEFGKGYLKKIIEVYSNTPVYDETFNEIFQDKLDVEKASKMLREVREGKIKITIKEGISPFGKMALEKRYEIVPPERPEKEIFEMFKKRLLETKVGMVCCNCAKWTNILKADEVPQKPRCESCTALLVAVVPKNYLLQIQELLKKRNEKEKIGEEDQRRLDMAMDSASLVLSFGKDAALVLAGRGIGVKTAGRVLAKMEKGDELLKNIIEAERNYVKTRRFWKG